MKIKKRMMKVAKVFLYVILLSVISCNKYKEFSKKENELLKNISYSDSVYVSFNKEQLRINLFNSDITTSNERISYTPIIAVIASDLMISNTTMINSNYNIEVNYISDKNKKFLYTLDYINNIKEHQELISVIVNKTEDNTIKWNNYFQNEKDFFIFRDTFCYQNKSKSINIYGVLKNSLGLDVLQYVVNNNSNKFSITFSSDNSKILSLIKNTN